MHNKGVFGWLKVTFVKRCEDEEKCEENGAIFMNTSHKLLGRLLSNSVCRVACTEGIKYMNLIEISPVIIEIWGVENGKLAVPVNNMLVRHTAFLATDTQLCILIWQFDESCKDSTLNVSHLSSHFYCKHMGCHLCQYSEILVLMKTDWFLWAYILVFMHNTGIYRWYWYLHMNWYL